MEEHAAGTRERTNGAREPAPRPAGDRIAPDDWASIFDGVTSEIDRSILALRRTVVIETARWRVALVEGLFGAALAGVGAIVGLVVAVLGTVFLLFGIRGALIAATGGGTWWIDLLLGVLILGGIAGTILGLRKRAGKKTLERTREKLAELSRTTGDAPRQEAT